MMTTTDYGNGVYWRDWLEAVMWEYIYGRVTRRELGHLVYLATHGQNGEPLVMGGGEG